MCPPEEAVTQGLRVQSSTAAPAHMVLVKLTEVAVPAEAEVLSHTPSWTVPPPLPIELPRPVQPLGEMEETG